MKSLTRLVGILLAILVVAATGGFLYLRQSLPTWQGEVEVPGLSASVEILRRFCDKHRDVRGTLHARHARVVDHSTATPS